MATPTPVETRWASAPPEPIALRENLLSWTRDGREAVYAYMARQYTPEIQQWIERRASEYVAKFAGEKEIRLWHEAAADLVAWQRHITAGKVLAWLTEWEKSVKQMEGKETT
jgi:hypothetical protein